MKAFGRMKGPRGMKASGRMKEPRERKVAGRMEVSERLEDLGGMKDSERMEGSGEMKGSGRMKDSEKMEVPKRMKASGKEGGPEKEQGTRKQRRPIGVRTPLALSLVAAVLLVFSAANSSRAALTYYSENYSAEFQMFDIGVTLLENGEEVSWRNYTQKDDVWQEGGGELLTHLLDGEAGGKIQPGKAYGEKLSVRNSGSIDQYVRVTLYRYWEDKDGNRVTDVPPGLIELGLAGDGWVEDPSAGTEERVVLYYTGILPAGQETPALSETLTIKEEAAFMTAGRGGQGSEGTDGGSGNSPAYRYNALRFVLEAEVNAVQTHNAEDAIKSAWGVDVSVGADGSLRLK